MTTPIICLMGPTASGKSNLALQLAREYPLEIISVDSVMVYKGFDIGSAKPSADILADTPHHLIDIRDANTPYSAGDFNHDVWNAIEAVQLRGKIPLLVGGTMLYFKILFQGIAPLPVADVSLRAHLDARANECGWAQLHTELQTIDPIAAQRIHANDSQRIQRALEVYHSSGKTLTEWQTQTADQLTDRQVHKLALQVDRSVLHESIAQRFQQMLQAGFIDEVETFFQRDDLHADLPALRSVGYREVWAYLKGDINYQRMCEQVVISTRQLAKRQMTWLRSFEGVEWVNATSDFSSLMSQCRVD